MGDARLAAIVSLLDEVESRINDHLGQATDLVNEVESVGRTLRTSLVQSERVRCLLSETAQLRDSIARQRAILAVLRQQLRLNRSYPLNPRMKRH